MVISNSRQYIFFHIPKCGGTTITHTLSEGLRWNDVVIGGTETGEARQGSFRARYGLGKHSLPAEVKAVVGRPLPEQYFKFAFVRDPVCRFVSAAQFIKHHVAAKSGWIAGALEDRYVKEIRKARSLSQLVNSTLVQGVLDRLQSNPDTALNDIELCFAPQSLYLDTQEKDAGRFAYLPIEQMDDAVRTLKAHGVVSEGATVDAIRHNSSHPTLAADLDDSALTLLRSWYRLDYMLAKSSGI
jgi:hypothetical protein